VLSEEEADALYDTDEGFASEEDIAAELQRINGQEAPEKKAEIGGNRLHVQSELAGTFKNDQIHYVQSPDELPESERHVAVAIRYGGKMRGWYNPETGHVYIYEPNIDSPERFEKTLLHEVVGHKGLRDLLGIEGFNRLCDKVYKSMSWVNRVKFMTYA